MNDRSQSLYVSDMGRKSLEAKPQVADLFSKVYDMLPSEPINKLKSHEKGVSCVAFSQQGSMLATGGGDCMVKLWEAAVSSGNDFKSIKVNNSPISCIAFNQTGQLLAAAGTDCTVSLVRTKPGLQIKARLQGHSDLVHSCCFTSAEKKQLLTAGQDRTIRLWDINTGQ